VYNGIRCLFLSISLYGSACGRKLGTDGTPLTHTAEPSTNHLIRRCPLPGLQARVPIRTSKSGVWIKISHRCETRPGLALDVRDWFPATRISWASYGFVFKLNTTCV